jgi:RNA polymerase sigma factor (TIGR02999 family)
VNPDPITVLLSRLNSGDREALNHLIPLVYHELRRIAEGYLRREAHNHTLQATALVHEAYLRMVEYGVAEYKSRAHFFGVAARVMRQILVDHARARRAAKRDRDTTVSHPHPALVNERDRALVALDDALIALATEDPWKARLIEMRFFAGLNAEQIAASAGRPLHIVRRELRIARAWLRKEMASGGFR